MTATNEQSVKATYESTTARIRRAFETDGDGVAAVAARTALADTLVTQLWVEALDGTSQGPEGIAVVALGGYGRSTLFPHSDVDLLFCTERGGAERAKDAVRRLSLGLWDCGLRVAPAVRTVSECERFSPENSEFSLSLLDRRLVAGDAAVFSKLDERLRTRLMTRDAKPLRAELQSLTLERHGKYGNTLFHLEPNVKDCPGGLRDANVCTWLAMLRQEVPSADAEFADALAFLASTRCFLHYRHDRDDNTLDWQAQDDAAERAIGLPKGTTGSTWTADAAYWMRAYFRHARVIERRLQRAFQSSGLTLFPGMELRRTKLAATERFRIKDGQIEVDASTAADPEAVLSAFAAMARSGARLDAASEERITEALPQLSSHLEEGPALWRKLAAILTGERAGAALRSMHAIGVLELVLPEFHGIDALVIRDAYHRYTVDEHTFVLIDTLHDLEREPGREAPEWRMRFGGLIRELQNPALLYLAALLHDTGKGRVGDSHAVESAGIAQAVLARLEMDPYEAALVLRLIKIHLEMSAALRRDIFDAGTVRVLANKVQTHETLRMLTLFTYADIQAVHPDALTPWKAENLWRLSMSAANQLDRSVDEERVHANGRNEESARVLALLPGRSAEAEQFLEGFPERYLKIRSPEAIRQHFESTQMFDEEPFQIAYQHGTTTSEITLVTRDRPRLFSRMAGALAAWGMNVVTADAFANSGGVVVDTFRFMDTFRTLELNGSERERFVGSVRDLVSGQASIETMLKGRRRGKRRVPKVKVETRIEFDDTASAHSTLMQVVAQDVSGLLRTLSETLSQLGYNVEVALVDTEGEMAIDVFYLTREGRRLNSREQEELRGALFVAIEENAR